MSEFERIGILGSGGVAEGLGAALVAAGCEVMLSARSADKQSLVAWAESNGDRAHAGSFADAAAFSPDLVLCALSGMHALAALSGLEQALAGKTVLDLTNPLDFSQGMPPRLTVPSGDSLGEQIQKALPEAKVVKGLNTVATAVMMNPGGIPGLHHLFLCGDDADAKTTVREFLQQRLGWSEESFMDLGDMTAARTTEAYVPLILQLFGTLQTPMASVRVVHG